MKTKSTALLSAVLLLLALIALTLPSGAMALGNRHSVLRVRFVRRIPFAR